MTSTPAAPRPLKKLLLIGVLLEVIIFIYCYLSFTESAEVFRFAARYSGRLSWLVYLFSFYHFSINYQLTDPTAWGKVKNLITVFCVLHFIHLGFLATNVLMNDIELIPVKLAGGALAYLLILVYPFVFDRIRNKRVHSFYFLYIGFVMAMTYLARLKGDFEGAEPAVIHYLGLGAIIIAFLGFAFLTRKK